MAQLEKFAGLTLYNISYSLMVSRGVSLHVKVSSMKIKNSNFCCRLVGGPVYHLQTSIIVDLAVTSQTQLCLSHNQCGPLWG